MISNLSQKYKPSEPCSCEVCVGYCSRPGWWTISEAAKAMEAGYSGRMMLEMSQDNTFGVLSPAFKGNEVNFAYEIFRHQGCTFLENERCLLFGTGHQPLECRYCHHERKGLGIKCHADIGKEWNSKNGKELVVKWAKQTGFWEKISTRS